MCAHTYKINMHVHIHIHILVHTCTPTTPAAILLYPAMVKSHYCICGSHKCGVIQIFQFSAIIFPSTTCVVFSLSSMRLSLIFEQIEWDKFFFENFLLEWTLPKI